MNLQTVIFDFGGVLVNIRYRRFVEALGLDHSTDETALFNMLMPDGHLYESGKISTQEFFHRLYHHFDQKYTESQLHQAWYAILAEEVDGMRSVVEQLSQLYPLYLLSNTNELHFEYAKKQYPVLNSFTQYFVSYKIGAMKPSREIYNHVISTLGKKPEELLLIDDVEKNVEGAKSVGMHSVVFSGAEHLRTLLQDEGFRVV